MDIRQRFAKNLKAARSLRKVSQEILAERLGITVRYVQLLESKTPPNVKIETLEKISKTLKIKASYLIK